MTIKQTFDYAQGIIDLMNKIHLKYKNRVKLEIIGNSLLYKKGIRGIGMVWNSKQRKFNPIAGVDVNRTPISQHIKRK